MALGEPHYLSDPLFSLLSSGIVGTSNFIQEDLIDYIFMMYLHFICNCKRHVAKYGIIDSISELNECVLIFCYYALRLKYPIAFELI